MTAASIEVGALPTTNSSSDVCTLKSSKNNLPTPPSDADGHSSNRKNSPIHDDHDNNNEDDGGWNFDEDDISLENEQNNKNDNVTSDIASEKVAALYNDEPQQPERSFSSKQTPLGNIPPKPVKNDSQSSTVQALNDDTNEGNDEESSLALAASLGDDGNGWGWDNDDTDNFDF
uniref:Uncharacterized protein n=1 Tax=Proboscia inermis TaxID=420281 RepID=A0A7S0CCS0_9STRA|mmetsp:Transcript_40624/g.41316  ORF Transcript_40624/g.41316 Transcript_40624/m.41316 type:complete len:174 (+) Transcript_40624:1-522(+)